MRGSSELHAIPPPPQTAWPTPRRASSLLHSLLVTPEGLKPRIMGVVVHLVVIVWASLGWSRAAEKPPSLSVAVILGQTRAVPESALRPARGVGAPLDVSVLGVQMNQTDPGSMLTHLCELMSRQRLHGLVYGDGTDQEAVAQMLDFVSSQTSMPILGIHGGSAMTMAEKVRRSGFYMSANCWVLTSKWS
ncbi:hypothetical protein AOLI_G00242330 [Acnodon oligacanthus]